ncbi:hypothetical protein [Allomuricauda sp. SCSIO 65647]|uniref:hypothetical protein n=1 Tax=Allomuricauda sp. SCSIO 65647 TaxID=2908843 RepID=UPI001F20FFEB|nr:hypothetical protein [Muricauda sp. SCSIO 65647]UJH66961.1 hypothetical protein L0P89_13490 [Muricauda sp. SCSIO 65647]
MENFGLEELNDPAQKSLEGGSWLGRGIGWVLGAAVRYGGPNGAITAHTDMIVYFAQK